MNTYTPVSTRLKVLLVLCPALLDILLNLLSQHTESKAYTDRILNQFEGKMLDG